MLLLPFLVGCEGEVPPADRSPGSDRSPEDTPATFPASSEVLDREFLFVSTDADSTSHAAWLFRARPGEEVVLREWKAWWARNGRWELLVEETGESPAAGSPWRILPGERVRLIVDPGDRIRSLILRDPPLEMEMELEELLTEWPGIPGGLARLHQGAVLLAAERAQGFVLDVARAWEEPGAGPGDWIFLHSGARFQLFLAEAPSREGTRTPASYRGWSRLAFRDGQWPQVQVTWEEVQAFENARRDIPTRWSLTSPGQEIVGEMEALGRHLSAGEGEGPLLPVLAFFEVMGSVRIEGEELEVTGIVSHRQR